MGCDHLGRWMAARLADALPLSLVITTAMLFTTDFTGVALPALVIAGLIPPLQPVDRWALLQLVIATSFAFTIVFEIISE